MLVQVLREVLILELWQGEGVWQTLLEYCSSTLRGQVINSQFSACLHACAGAIGWFAVME